MEDRKIAKQTLKVAFVMVLVGIFIKVSYELKWIDVILGITKLESSPESIQRISFKGMSYITRCDREEAFMSYMNSKGWRFVKQYGRGLLFDKEGYEIVITKRDVLNRYSFFDVASKSIFEMV